MSNVMGGFHSFLAWVASDVLKDYTPPQFQLPEIDEHRPAILSQEMQWRVLLTIQEAQAGIFYFLAQTASRPSEARVLRVRDWTGDEGRACLRRISYSSPMPSRAEIRSIFVA